MAATVLITGANGFIGSHAVLLFESAGHRVVGIDVLPRSKDLSVLPIKCQTAILDVTDTRALGEMCRKENVTHIFHAAHPPREEDPSVLNFCYQAMRNILDLAKESKLGRVAYASSGAVYGQLRREGRPLIKEDDPVAIYPTFFYRSAKILSEWLGDFYAQNHGVSFVALRFSSVYGPGLWRGLPLAIREGLLGRPCRIFLTRIPDDPVYIDDVVAAVRLALFADRPLSRAYNIALGRGYLDEDLERAMRKKVPEVSFEIGQNSDAVTVGKHRDRDILDISLAKRELGFTPKVDLESGIGAIADWVRENKSCLS